MKQLIFGFLFLTSSMAMAAVTSTHTSCGNTILATQKGLITVTLDQNGLLNADEELLSESHTNDDNYSLVTVDGLKAVIVKADLFDHYSAANFAWVPVHRDVDVYASKIVITANETIGSELRGDIMFPVKQMTVYAFCHSETQIMGHMN